MQHLDLCERGETHFADEDVLELFIHVERHVLGNLLYVRIELFVGVKEQAWRQAAQYFLLAEFYRAAHASCRYGVRSND